MHAQVHHVGFMRLRTMLSFMGNRRIMRTTELVSAFRINRNAIHNAGPRMLNELPIHRRQKNLTERPILGNRRPFAECNQLRSIYGLITPKNADCPHTIIPPIGGMGLLTGPDNLKHGTTTPLRRRASRTN